MKSYLFLLLTCISPLLHAQVNEELVYPVVPIADECHKAFDNSDSIIIMSKKDFLALDSIWTTFNTCYNYTNDTLWLKEFEITFAGLMNDGEQSYLLSDGNLNNEYQSSLQDARKNIKPFDHIYLRNMQFEQHGGMYQIADIHIVIDSLVKPELDTCWTYFPLPPPGPKELISITKKRFTRLLTDSFGYNRCENIVEWPDKSIKANMWIAPRSLFNHYNINTYINDYNLASTSDLTRPIKEVNKLSYADVIVFRRLVYKKDEKYYYSPEYRFSISDKLECSKSVNIEKPDTTFLSQVFQLIRNDTISRRLCFVNSKGFPVSFKAVMIPQNGSPSMMSSSGMFHANMILALKKLQSGDKIILEGINSDDLYENKKSNYKPVVITLP